MKTQNILPTGVLPVIGDGEVSDSNPIPVSLATALDATYDSIVSVPDINVMPVTIASGGTDSEVIDFRKYRSIAIEMPSTWTAANITIKSASSFGGTYSPVYGADGTLLTITEPSGGFAGKIVALDLFSEAIKSLHYIKLCSTVAQGGDRILNAIIKG